MCWICDHPGATERDLPRPHAAADRRATAGPCRAWSGTASIRRGPTPSGSRAHRRPELVVTGMGLTRATEVLNGVAAHLLHAEAPAPGTQATLLDGPLVEIVRVATPWAHLNLAVEFYGNRRIQRPAARARR